MIELEAVVVELRAGGRLSSEDVGQCLGEGSATRPVFRDPDDPNWVWVFTDWKIEDYEKFLSIPRSLRWHRSSPYASRW